MHNHVLATDDTSKPYPFTDQTPRGLPTAAACSTLQASLLLHRSADEVASRLQAWHRRFAAVCEWLPIAVKLDTWLATTGRTLQVRDGFGSKLACCMLTLPGWHQPVLALDLLLGPVLLAPWPQSKLWHGIVQYTLNSWPIAASLGKHSCCSSLQPCETPMQ